MPSTIRELAALTGFSTATVSLALKDSPRISEKTRRKIKAAADQVGYVTPPLLSKAFSLARQPNTGRFREKIAAITEYEFRETPIHEQEIFRHAVEHGRAIGYELDTFVASDRKSDHRRLSRILVTRGIRGVIVFPRIRHQHSRVYFDWGHFAAVEIGRTLWHPSTLHKIERSLYHELVEAFHLLKKKGFRRIGMAIEPAEEIMRRNIYSAAYHTSQQWLPARERIPSVSSHGPWGLKSFRKWFQEYRPDALVAYQEDFVPGWLDQMGVAVPEEVSLFFANARVDGLSGFRSDLKAIGESCVDILSLLLDRNELGLPAKPKIWQVRDNLQIGGTMKFPLDMA